MVERYSLAIGKIVMLIWTRLLLTLTLFAPLLVSAQVRVLTTTGMIKDAVANIGGDTVVVESLMGSGVDPHLYKATHGDLRRFQKAEVIFYNGLHLEGKLASILENLAKKKPCVAIASGVPKKKLLFPDGQESAADPHIWFDVDLWARALAVIPKALSEVDPKNGKQYEMNFRNYLGELLKLDQWVTAEIASIPKQGRVLLTAHDAFGYFGRRYKIEVMGLQGISTASEFGLFDVQRIADTVVRRKIKAVFVETSVPRKFVEALQAGVHVRDTDLEIGGELYSDAMGLEGSPEGTYTGMVTHNVNTIVNALK